MGAPQGHPGYAGSELGGRPTRYTSEYIEHEADAFEKWMEQPSSIYFKRFAINRGYHPQRLSEFAAQNERFSEVYERAKAWQEAKLVEGGLLNEFNAGFTKFVLGNTAGWTEKTQVSGDAINPLQFVLDKVDGRSKELVIDDQE